MVKVIRSLCMDDYPETEDERDYYYRMEMGYPVNEEDYLIIDPNTPYPPTIILLSGPSTTGKSVIFEAIKKYYPHIKTSEIVVTRSKESRPNCLPRDKKEESVWNNEYYFRFSNEIKALQNNPRYLTGQIRPQVDDNPTWQAIDLDKIKNAQSTIFIEAYHTLGAKLLENEYLKDYNKISIFLTPVSLEQMNETKFARRDVQDYIFGTMMSRLNLRSRFQNNGSLSDKSFMENSIRAKDAYYELKSARNYSHVIHSPIAEGPGWNINPDGSFIGKPQGDALKTLESVVEILNTGNSKNTENWKNCSF